MPLCRFTTGESETPRVGLLSGGDVRDLGSVADLASIDRILTTPLAELRAALDALDHRPLAIYRRDDCTLLAPIESQEVWACGVTYERSRDARMHESTQRDVYDRVYDAARPEIFFKATPSRVVGPGAAIVVRADSNWDVPEPELAVVLNDALEVVGYTVGNDVSSRQIEGENPLYLPQAKVYAACCALGPAIVPAWEVPDPTGLAIRLEIERGGQVVFRGSCAVADMRRTPAELVDWLFRGQRFPCGVVLLTGTSVVPPAGLSLEAGDRVRIAITGLGELRNPVVTVDTSPRRPARA
jgi:2-dehydro-3-deoxy-D-arabinonate dehydratase